VLVFDAGIDTNNSECNVSNQTERGSSGIIKATVVCRVSYNGTDSGSDPRNNYLYPLAEWNDCNPTPNVSYALPDQSITPYYRTFIDKADFLLSVQNAASLTCTYKVLFRSNVIDQWLDKRDPVFIWNGLVYNWTGRCQ